MVAYDKNILKANLYNSAKNSKLQKQQKDSLKRCASIESISKKDYDNDKIKFFFHKLFSRKIPKETNGQPHSKKKSEKKHATLERRYSANDKMMIKYDQEFLRNESLRRKKENTENGKHSKSSEDLTKSDIATEKTMQCTASGKNDESKPPKSPRNHHKITGNHVRSPLTETENPNEQNDLTKLKTARSRDNIDETEGNEDPVSAPTKESLTEKYYNVKEKLDTIISELELTNSKLFSLQSELDLFDEEDPDLLKEETKLDAELESTQLLLKSVKRFTFEQKKEMAHNMKTIDILDRELKSHRKQVTKKVRKTHQVQHVPRIITKGVQTRGTVQVS